MKKKELKEIRAKNNGQIAEMIKKSQLDLVKLKTDLKAGKLKSMRDLKKKKQELAVGKTLLRERELLDLNDKIHKEPKQKET